MTFWLASLFLLSLVDGAFSCQCTPKQWEGTEGIIGGYTDQSGGHSINGYSRVSYDAVNRKIAAFSEMYYDSKKIKTFALLDYDARTMYVVNENVCNVTKLGEFPDSCVPPNAKKVADTHIGAGSDSLDVTSYSISLDAPEAKGVRTFTLTNDLCIPVGETVQGELNGVSMLQVIGITGVEPGIKDPSVFRVPEICRGKGVKVGRDQPAEGKMTALDYLVRRMTTRQSQFGF